MESTIICRHCGAEIDAHARFCTYCGTATVAETPVPPAAIEIEAVAPVTEPVAIAEPASVAEPVAIAEPVAVAVAAEPLVEAPPAAPVTPAEPVVPPVYAPAPDYTVMPPVTAPPRIKRSRGKSVAAVCICIAVFFLLSTALSLLNVRLATTQDAIEDSAHDIFDNLDMTEIPAADVIDGADESDGSLIEWAIAQALASSDDDNTTVTVRDVQRFLEDSAIIDRLCEQLYLYVQDIYDDTNHSRIRKQDIRRVINADLDLIYASFGEQLSVDDIETILENVEDSGVIDLLEASYLKKQLPAVYYAIHYLFSYVTIVVLMVLGIGLLVLLAKVNGWNWQWIARDIGILLAVLGGLMVVPLVLATVLLGIVSATVSGGPLVSAILSPFLLKGLLPGIIVLVLGIGALVTSHILKKKQKQTAAV